MEVSVNLLAVLLSGVASMVIGFLWYSKSMFGVPWMAEMGYTEKELRQEQAKMGPLYALSFVASLVTAYILSHVTTFSEAYLGSTSLSAGVGSGFWMWLGFVAPVQMTDVIFGKKSWKLWRINTSYQLATLLAMGAIIGSL